MENPPFEDVFPIGEGEFLLPFSLLEGISIALVRDPFSDLYFKHFTARGSMPKYIDNWKQNDSCPFLGGTTRSFLQKLVFEISWGFHVFFSSDIIFSLSFTLGEISTRWRFTRFFQWPLLTWDQLVKNLQSRSSRASFTSTKNIGLEEYYYTFLVGARQKTQGVEPKNLEEIPIKLKMILGGISMSRWSIANVLTWLPYPIYPEIFVRSWGSSMYPGLLQLADSKFVCMICSLNVSTGQGSCDSYQMSQLLRRICFMFLISWGVSVEVRFNLDPFGRKSDEETVEWTPIQRFSGLLDVFQCHSTLWAPGALGGHFCQIRWWNVHARRHL